MPDLPKLTKSSTSYVAFRVRNVHTGEKSYMINWRCPACLTVIESGFRTRTQAEMRAKDIMSGAMEPVAFQWEETANTHPISDFLAEHGAESLSLAEITKGSMNIPKCPED